MKNTAVQIALNDITKAVQVLEETIEARDDALKGWIAVADERARRFKNRQDDMQGTMTAFRNMQQEAAEWEQRYVNLEADMQGTMTTLNDERAQSAAKIKALETQCTELNRALRSADNIASDLLDQLAETRKLVVAQRLVINDMQAQR